MPRSITPEATQAVLGVPYRLAENPGPEPRFVAAPGAPEASGVTLEVHTNIVRLTTMYGGRALDQPYAQMTGDDLANWGADVRAGVLRRDGVALRHVARTLLRHHNSDRIQARAGGPGSRRGREFSFVPFTTVLDARPETPADLVRHLKEAHYFGMRRTYQALLDTPVDSLHVPSDALAYLDLYPPAPLAAETEKTLAHAAALFGVTAYRLSGAVTELGLPTLVRRGEHQPERETLCMGPDAVSALRTYFSRRSRR